MRTLLIAAALVAVQLQTGCALMGAGKSSTLKPSELSAELRDLDADPANPFAKDGSRVEYTEVEIQKYDAFAKEAAEVQGTVVLADLLVRELKASTGHAIGAVMPNGDVQHAAADATLNAATTGKPMSPEQKAVVEKELARVKVVEKLLLELPKRSISLVATGKELVTGAPKTFTGPKALQLPAVTRSLNASISRLQDAGDRAPKLAQAMHETTVATVALLSGKPVPSDAPGKPAKKARKTASASNKKPAKG